jgi:hypothetical protein
MRKIMNKIGTCFLGFLGNKGSEMTPLLDYPELGKPRAMSTCYPDQTLEYNDVFKYLNNEIRKQYQTYDSTRSEYARNAYPKTRKRKSRA